MHCFLWELLGSTILGRCTYINTEYLCAYLCGTASHINTSSEDLLRTQCEIQLGVFETLVFSIWVRNLEYVIYERSVCGQNVFKLMIFGTWSHLSVDVNYFKIIQVIHVDEEALCGAGGFRVPPWMHAEVSCTRGLLCSKKVKLMMADWFSGLTSHPFLLDFYPIT